MIFQDPTPDLFIATSNHIHLLLMDTKENVISKSMQLIAGRTAQEYNIRRGRKGAFWEDRYHATAVQADSHLAQGMVYIDLNMVRAGVVKHPCQNPISGYHEIQKSPNRYSIIDFSVLLSLFNQSSVEDFQKLHRDWIDYELETSNLQRDEHWSSSIAVGNELYIQDIAQQLAGKINGREVMKHNGRTVLKEPNQPYNTLFRP